MNHCLFTRGAAQPPFGPTPGSHLVCRFAVENGGEKNPEAALISLLLICIRLSNALRDSHLQLSVFLLRVYHGVRQTPAGRNNFESLNIVEYKKKSWLSLDGF